MQAAGLVKGGAELLGHMAGEAEESKSLGKRGVSSLALAVPAAAWLRCPDRCRWRMVTAGPRCWGKPFSASACENQGRLAGKSNLFY